MKKSKKHKSLVEDYDNQKAKHLEKLASKMLDQDEKNQRLKNKPSSGEFLKFF
jgi:hypothetical protein